MIVTYLIFFISYLIYSFYFTFVEMYKFNNEESFNESFFSNILASYSNTNRAIIYKAINNIVLSFCFPILLIYGIVSYKKNEKESYSSIIVYLYFFEIIYPFYLLLFTFFCYLFFINNFYIFYVIYFISLLESTKYIISPIANMLNRKIPNIYISILLYNPLGVII